MKDYEEGEGGSESAGSGEGRRGIRMKPNYFMPKPVKVGDELEVTIEAVATKGDGIAKKDGFVIFVPKAKNGDKLKVRITDVKARFAVAEIVQ
jgi:predicted RNA-binding protein with TRAM domain